MENRAKTCHSGTRKKKWEKKVLVKSKLFVFYLGVGQNLYLEKSLGGVGVILRIVTKWGRFKSDKAEADEELMGEIKIKIRSCADTN